MGDVLASGMHGKILKKQQIRLWDARTGEEIRSFEVEGDCQMDTLEFSPDGALLMADCNKTVVWEVSSGRKLWEQSIKMGDIRSPRFLAMGEGIASVDCRFANNRRFDMPISLCVRDPRTGEVTSECDIEVAWGGAILRPAPQGKYVGMQYARYGIPISLDHALRSIGLPNSWVGIHVHSSGRVFDTSSGQAMLTVRDQQVLLSCGNLVAASNDSGRGDGGVRIFDLPAPKPWGLILGWALVGPLAIVGLQMLAVFVGRGLGWFWKQHSAAAGKPTFPGAQAAALDVRMRSSCR